MFACKTFFIILGIAMLSHETLAGKDFFQCDLDKVCKTVLKVISPGYIFVESFKGGDGQCHDVLGCKYKKSENEEAIWYDIGVGGTGENDAMEYDCTEVPTTGLCHEIGVKKDILKDAC